MSIVVKKSELEQVLLNISTYSAPDQDKKQELVSGLLKESLPLSAKRRLQKIHKKTHEAYKELSEDVQALKKDCGEDEEKFTKEVIELLGEDVTIDADKVQLALIEAISSSANYNFDIIEKFSE